MCCGTDAQLGDKCVANARGNAAASLGAADRSSFTKLDQVSVVPSSLGDTEASTVVLSLKDKSLIENKKIALVTGVTGQDGAYLCQLLLSKDYIVHGIKRRSSSFNTGRIENLYEDPHVEHPHLILHYGDMTDSTNLIRIVQQCQPDEIYNLAAQSHVMVSFETPEYTANADALGTLRLLEAKRILRLEDKVRFYQASTSELYGMV